MRGGNETNEKRNRKIECEKGEGGAKGAEALRMLLSNRRVDVEREEKAEYDSWCGVEAY